jgi:hypothetical protein
MPQTPPTVRGAATVQAAESVMVLAGTILAGVDAASGQSYHVSSGIALTVIGALAAVGLAWIARGLARARRWSRTPAVLTQLFVGIVGIYLLQGHRLDWGIPSVVLAVAGFALLFAPPSLRALTGQAAAAGRQADGQRAAHGQKTPAAARRQSAAGGKKPAPEGKKPAAEGKKPASGGKHPATGGKQPAPAQGRKRPAQ